ncbi:MAG: TIGR00366 family protein [Bacteroidota bacterium]
MNGVTKLIAYLFRRYLPSPFTIAVLLTALTFLLALVFTENTTSKNHFFVIVKYWESGVWNSGLLVFAYQMMLILVLGHVLVLSSPMEKLILKLTKYVKDSSSAAVLVALPTMLVSFFNWGLGLIFGAILARKVGEYAQEQGVRINYPLIGACGYLGLMVWHGGISGSAPLKVAEKDHLKDLMSQIPNKGILANLPTNIPTSSTIFSFSNIMIFFCVVVTLSVLGFFMGKRMAPTTHHLEKYQFKARSNKNLVGAEKLDHARLPSQLFGALIILGFLIQYLPSLLSLNITPNMLNFFMLGMAIVLHRNFKSFLTAVEEAVGDVSGILIQFPLYFGIMGIMSSSGMIIKISDFFVSVSNETTLPIYTFFSAGLVNLFVPSGGGQWAIQGPLILRSALQLNVPLHKAVLALAYGDQLTNMLQPFWALPLLGVTKLKAREILPYTLIFMLFGGIIYLLGLLIF